MDNTSNRPRDMVYCHQCENEWFRDEHGLTCPSCRGEFVEIIEAENDPRSDGHFDNDDDIHHTHPPTGQRPNDLGDYYAPDPDEDDIDDFRWQQTGPDTYRVRGTYRTEIPVGSNGETAQQGQQAQGQQGLMGMVGSVLQNMLGAQTGAQQQQQQTQPQQGQQGRLYQQPSPWQQGQWFGGDAPPASGRPGSAPGSPLRSPPTETFRNGNTYIRRGPGFSLTIATSSNPNLGGTLFPRNANGPQPFQPQPDHIEQIMAQIFANIVPGQNGGMRMAPGMHPFDDDHEGFMGGPFIIQGGAMPGQPARGVGLANLFQLFAPPGGVAGDAVYSQEALDRIITQLMEQHQTGNAPGPASEAAIKALPTKTISSSDQSDTGKAECSICMDEVPLGGTVTMLPCHHWFHAECIRAWLGEHDTCPHCRQGIMPKDDDANSTRPRQPDQAPRHDMRSPEYTRPSPHGAFPFPRQNSAGSPSGGPGAADGSQQSPFVVPDSPTMNRRSSSGVERRRSSGNTGGGGVFSRMRDAFGGGSGGSSGGRT